MFSLVTCRKGGKYHVVSCLFIPLHLVLPGGSDSKDSTHSARVQSLILKSGRSPGLTGRCSSHLGLHTHSSSNPSCKMWVGVARTLCLAGHGPAPTGCKQHSPRLCCGGQCLQNCWNPVTTTLLKLRRLLWWSLNPLWGPPSLSWRTELVHSQ